MPPFMMGPYSCEWVPFCGRIWEKGNRKEKKFGRYFKKEKEKSKDNDYKI